MNVHPKVAAAGVAGVAATLLVLAAGLLGVTIPDGVSAALVTILTFAAGYFRPAPAKA